MLRLPARLSGRAEPRTHIRFPIPVVSFLPLPRLSIRHPRNSSVAVTTSDYDVLSSQSCSKEHPRPKRAQGTVTMEEDSPSWAYTSLATSHSPPPRNKTSKLNLLPCFCWVFGFVTLNLCTKLVGNRKGKTSKYLFCILC